MPSGSHATLTAGMSANESLESLGGPTGPIAVRASAAEATCPTRGVTLGGTKLHVARRNAQVAITAEADRHAANVLPIIREAQKAGATTLREIAAVLERSRGRNGTWGPMARHVREQHS